MLKQLRIEKKIFIKVDFTKLQLQGTRKVPGRYPPGTPPGTPPGSRQASARQGTHKVQGTRKVLSSYIPNTDILNIFAQKSL